ncbi:MAG: ACT domain-containing protein [Proteobacteria bacterium]|nr:ACT domain-containing protein [Pseudomonadota bacterium]
MDKQQMVLTAIGPDRPGIVKEISSAIHESGANLEDSRMAVLAGDFALIVLFSGEPDSIETIREKCKTIEQKLDFQITFKPSSSRKEGDGHRLYRFQATGVDQPGIVHTISAILAEFDVNVVSLESRLSHAAFHGTAIFTFHAEIQVSTQDVIDSLTDRLDEACEELDLDYDMELI